MDWRRVAAYFLTPFPSTKGFSAYRMPGPAVHLAMIIVMLYVGSALCWANESTRPLLAIWVVAGIYLGRDATIAAHYVPFLGLLGLLLFLAIPLSPALFPETLARWRAGLVAIAQVHPSMAWGATALLGIGQIVRVVYACRRSL